MLPPFAPVTGTQLAAVDVLRLAANFSKGCNHATVRRGQHPAECKRCAELFVQLVHAALHKPGGPYEFTPSERSTNNG